jgi:hypothetical protein
MRLKLAIALVAALAMTAGWPAPPPAEARDTSGISISLWHMGSLPERKETTPHIFWAQVHNYASHAVPLTDLTIVTSCGDIVFEDHSFDGSIASVDAMTFLHVHINLSCPKFIVVRAHGRLDGETVDLTDRLTLETTEIVPMELVTTSTSRQGGSSASQKGEAACESKQTPAGYIEGRYQGQECEGDSCLLSVKLDSGVDLAGYADLDVQALDPPIGTKVRLEVSDAQFYDEEAEPPCVRYRLFTSIKKVR